MACLFAHSNDTPIRDALREFHMFTPAHGVMIGALVLGAAILLRIGFKLCGTPAQRSFERIVGWIGIVLWIIANAYGYLPGVLDWRYALPIGVCDTVALVGPIVLVLASPPTWLRAWLYFVGLGLCTQAFITPTLQEGPADARFWLFWGVHFMILFCPLHELIVRRWRPTWRAWRLAVTLSVAYLCVVLPINLLGGWNYAFIGREMRAGTLIEVLGPWPGRVAIILALVIVMYTCMMLPWVSFNRAPRRV